jgi:TM2 domain-containing membrane protein YozV
MKLLNCKTFFIALLIIINTTVSAKEKTLLHDEYTAEKISSFICYLINNGEYYRAYVELLRLNSFYPSHIDQSVYDVTASYLFYKSKKYSDLLEQTDLQKTSNPAASLFRIDSLIMLDKKDEAESELLKLYGSDLSKDIILYLKKRMLYLSLINNKNDPELSDYSASYEELFLFSESVHQKKKNPIAGMFSGLIPGMGYIYAGETGTGIAALIVIGVGSGVTFAAYRNGSQSVALISGLITFFFYGGSIAGGYMQTVKYNSRLMDSLELRLDRELMPDKDLDEVYFKIGLSSKACK